MIIRVNFRPKAILALLVAVLILASASYFLFTKLTQIVHGDLYNYGLVYDSEWAILYWNNSNPFQITLFLTMAATSFALLSLIVYAKKQINLAKTACNLLLLTSLAASISSIYFFSRMDYIVNHDLYSYGLRFDIQWASNYWTYSTSIPIMTSTAIALTASSMALLFLGSRKRVELSFAKLSIISLIGTGLLALILSIIFELAIPAFIGLGLVFWGIILTYMRTEDYTKKSLLDATVSSQQSTINQIMPNLNFRGKPVYLPPKYFSKPETVKVYIARQKDGPLPSSELLPEEEKRLYIANPPGLILNPPGIGLTKLFERVLKTSFTQVDLQFLQQNMPKLLIDNLEICQNYEMRIQEDKIHVVLNNSLLKVDEDSDTQHTNNEPLSPLTSAMACAFAKATGQPITIEKVESNDDVQDISIEYRILSET